MNNQNAQDIVSLSHAEPIRSTDKATCYKVEGERFNLFFPDSKHSYTESTGTVHVSRSLLDQSRAYQQEQADQYYSGQTETPEKATEATERLTTPEDVKAYLQASLQQIKEETDAEVTGLNVEWTSPLPEIEVTYR